MEPYLHVCPMVGAVELQPLGTWLYVLPTYLKYRWVRSTHLQQHQLLDRTWLVASGLLPTAPKGCLKMRSTIVPLLLFTRGPQEHGCQWGHPSIVLTFTVPYLSDKKLASISPVAARDSLERPVL